MVIPLELNSDLKNFEKALGVVEAWKSQAIHHLLPRKGISKSTHNIGLSLKVLAWLRLGKGMPFSSHDHAKNLGNKLTTQLLFKNTGMVEAW